MLDNKKSKQSLFCNSETGSLSSSKSIDLVQYLYDSRGKKYFNMGDVVMQLVNFGAQKAQQLGSVWQRLTVVACEEFDAGMLKVTAVTKKAKFTDILA
jgi:hypothetical protein